MNVTQVSRRFTRRSWGGTETVVLETSRRLLAAGHETRLVCPNALDSRASETVEGLSVERVPYFYPYFGLSSEDRDALDRKGGNMFSASLFWRLMRQPAPDVYHLHTGKRIGGIVRTVARLRRVPYVVSIHGGVADVPADERATWTEPTQGAFEWGKALGWLVGSRRVLEDAAAVICVGRREAELLREALPRTRVLHLPNGVDVERFGHGSRSAFRERFGIPERARLIASVGRIDPQKNQLGAVEVLDSVRHAHPDAHLLLVGHVTDPAYRARVEERVREKGLESRVTLIPGLDARSDELVGAYRAADLFLLPSLHEPFGIAIVEAWAAGIPVVASRVGGIPGFVEHGTDALLYAPDRLDEAARLVGRVLSDASLATRIAEAGAAEAVLQFGWDRITRELLSVYRSVIAARGTGRSSSTAIEEVAA